MSINNNINPYINRGISTEKKTKVFENKNQEVIDDRQYVPDQFKEVARSMEEQFVQIMLDQMEKTVDQNDLDSGAGMDYYRSLEKLERAKIMTNQNNLGLQDMVLEQIYPKRLRNEVALKNYQAQNSLIQKNLPSYKIDTKSDTIEMRKNDSTSLSEPTNVDKTREDGGLDE